jgi:hypothetical protein
MATQTDYAWAAGFFDGEGCVSARSGRYVGLSITVIQKDIRPIRKFSGIFACEEKIRIVHRDKRKNHYYQIVLCADKAASVLSLMLPYLSLKRDVAEVGLNLQSSINVAHRGFGGLTEDDLQYRRLLAEQIKWLNTGRWAAATTKSEGLE